MRLSWLTKFLFSQLFQIGVEGQTDGTVPASRAKQPKTPRSKSSAAATANSSKVVKKDFTPRTLRLALAAKSHIRTRTVYDEPFPRNNKIARINFAWQTIQESARASSDANVRQAYTRAKKDIAVKSKLTKFVNLSYTVCPKTHLLLSGPVWSHGTHQQHYI